MTADEVSSNVENRPNDPPTSNLQAPSPKSLGGGRWSLEVGSGERLVTSSFELRGFEVKGEG
jgi:hypothetical protein